MPRLYKAILERHEAGLWPAEIARQTGFSQVWIAKEPEMSETTKYALFWNGGWQPNEDELADLSFAEFLAECATEFGPPIAWAAEWPARRGGSWDCERLRAESIAAGRRIDRIDGKCCTARGFTEQPSMQRTGPSCAEQEEIWALQTAAACAATAAASAATAAANVATAGLTFPSGATVLTSGNTIVGRIDPNAGMVERDQRPAFTSELRTPFDAFKGFTVTGGGGNHAQDRSFAGLRLDAPGRFVAPRAI